MTKFSPLILTVFAVYVVALATYAGFCVVESNKRVAQIEKEFAPVEVPVMAPAPGKKLSPVRTSPWYPAEWK